MSPRAPVRWWRGWVALLSQRESPTTLACFRIALGVVVLYSLLSVGLNGLLDLLWTDATFHGGGYKYLGDGNWLMALLGGPEPAVVHALYGVSMACALAFTLGVGGRAIALATLLSYAALVSLNGETSGGYDLLITNALWLLVLGDATATLSLRCWRKTGHLVHPGTRSDTDAALTIPAWPRYLLIFQLLTMYTATGWQKFSLDWSIAGNYSALYRVFQEPTWRRFDMSFTAWLFPVTQVATIVTWLFEAVLPLLLLYWYYARHTRERPGRVRAWMVRRELRRWFVLIGIGLHIGILVTLDVGPFSWVSLAYYICLCPPHHLEAAAARVWRGRRRD
ncbi:HTTM domain-containing protein [Haliangium ochraceum]|uniref:HTTM domain protein n=1 Tax=Haliangium ochraceum (strain DSM 14365 / JCM 11303 / SMP-2) TaxID=502025 RepID=D0LG32_HALO1|nr:HTTM domain-containing protein [Haliangium ochraceum]ACY18057.1 HTTM domain protein [Haliangium ochraceum DSM 14365]